MFKPDVFAGNREVFNEKLRTLSEMAEPEKWTDSVNIFSQIHF